MSYSSAIAHWVTQFYILLPRLWFTISLSSELLCCCLKKKLITREEKVARLDEKKENERKKKKVVKKKIWKWKCIKGFIRKGSK
jgi:hypothetical protein